MRTQTRTLEDKKPMNTRGQSILLWTTPVAGALFLAAYILFPAFGPPLSPTLTPEEVAAFFRANESGILGVSIFCNLIGASLVPLFSVTAVQMLRIRNSSPIFAYAYILCVGIGITAFLLADYCWGMAAFRPERNPQLISLLNDMAWFFFIAPVGPIIVQNLCLATSIYLDKSPDPVFKPWVAHFNVASALLMIPSAFSLLHKTGPLAWDGSLSFTLRLVNFSAYVAVMFVVLVGVVRQQEQGQAVAA